MLKIFTNQQIAEKRDGRINLVSLILMVVVVQYLSHLCSYTINQNFEIIKLRKSIPLKTCFSYKIHFPATTQRSDIPSSSENSLSLRSQTYSFWFWSFHFSASQVQDLFEFSNNTYHDARLKQAHLSLGKIRENKSRICMIQTENIRPTQANSQTFP